jgi:hypothetical protein
MRAVNQEQLLTINEVILDKLDCQGRLSDSSSSNDNQLVLGRHFLFRDLGSVVSCFLFLFSVFVQKYAFIL